MVRTKKAWGWITAVFVVIQILLAHFIQNPPSSLAYAWLTLSSVALCFFYVLLAFEKTPFKILMLLAFSATVCADFFLTELVSFEGKKVVAMSCFCVVQAGYFLRLYRNHAAKAERRTHLIVRGAVCGAGLLAAWLVLGEKNDALSFISVFYFANLAVNVIFAFAQGKRSILFALGLLFFLSCDLFIGLAEMDAGFLPIPENSLLYRLTHTGVNIAWLFYVPSQALLAISVHDEKKKEDGR